MTNTWGMLLWCQGVCWWCCHANRFPDTRIWCHYDTLMRGCNGPWGFNLLHLQRSSECKDYRVVLPLPCQVVLTWILKKTTISGSCKTRFSCFRALHSHLQPLFTCHCQLSWYAVKSRARFIWFEGAPNVFHRLYIFHSDEWSVCETERQRHTTWTQRYTQKKKRKSKHPNKSHMLTSRQPSKQSPTLRALWLCRDSRYKTRHLTRPLECIQATFCIHIFN